MCCRKGRRLQHDSTYRTKIHQTPHESAELWFSEGTNSEGGVGTFNVALNVCALTVLATEGTSKEQTQASFEFTEIANYHHKHCVGNAVTA